MFSGFDLHSKFLQPSFLSGETFQVDLKSNMINRRQLPAQPPVAFGRRSVKQGQYLRMSTDAFGNSEKDGVRGPSACQRKVEMSGFLPNRNVLQG